MDSNKIDLDELANTKPELAAAIKCKFASFSIRFSFDIHASVNDSQFPGHSCVALIAESQEGVRRDPESLMMAQKGKSKRFSLKSLHPNVADVLSAFDFDGNGNVTVDEVQRGAELLKETKKKHKRAMWALVIQFVIYAALTAASCGVLYHFLWLMKDTAVDSSTGALMVKSNDGSSEAVEVSVQSHGKTFEVDAYIKDSVTGEVKDCVTEEKVREMFNLAIEGTDVRFLEKPTESGEIHVVRLGADDITMTEDLIDFGPALHLIPDEDCSKQFLPENYTEGDRELWGAPGWWGIFSF